MYTLITILIILVAIFLGAVVLIQNPKGGGLSGSFGGVGQQILGARRSTDYVEKATWGAAGLLLAFCVVTALFIDKKAVTTTGTEKSVIEQQQMNKGFNAPAQGQGMGNAPQQSAPVQQQQQPAGPAQ